MSGLYVRRVGYVLAFSKRPGVQQKGCGWIVIWNFSKMREMTLAQLLHSLLESRVGWLCALEKLPLMLLPALVRK